jgi:gliding motility-associated-like protein
MLFQLSPFLGLAQLTLGFNSNGNTAGCAPYTLTFPITNVSGNPANTSYTINFGDGSPVLNYTQATLPSSVTHTYTTNSCGSSYLTTSNVFGATITATNPTLSPFTAAVSPIVISSPPDALISPLTSTVCVGSTVSINNNSSEGVFIDPSAGYSCSTNGAIHYWTVSPATGWTASAANLGTTNGFPSPTDFDIWTTGAMVLPVTFTQTGSYRVKIWIANTCGLDTMSVPVCVVPPPNPQFTLNPSFGCIPPNLNVTANNTTTVASTSCNTPIYTYSWSVSPLSNWAYAGGSTSSSVSPSFSFLASGVYNITLNASINALSGCSASIIRSVTVNQQVTVNAGLDQSVCVGSAAFQLTGSPTGGTWSGPGVSSSGIYTPGAVGNTTLTYTIPASAGTGCPAATDQVIISVINPTPANAGFDQSFCPGASAVQLTATPTGGTWTGAGVTSTGVLTPSLTPGNTTLTYSFGTGACAVSDQKIITIYSPPSVNVNNPTVCSGSLATLTAVGSGGLGPYSYAWSPSSGLSAITGASVTCNPTVASNYSVTVTDAHSCTGTDVAAISVNALPVVSAGSNISVCNIPVATQLTGTPAGGTWSGTGVTASGAFTPTGIGNFTLTYSYTNASGCTGSSQMLASVVNPSTANAGGNQNLCIANAPLQVNGLPAGGTWSGTGVTSSGLFTPTGSGNVTLTYTYGSGTCASTDQMIVQVFNSPSVIVNNPTVCEGTNATLSAVGAGGQGPYSYAWTPSTALSATSGSVVTSSSTNTITYTVTLTDNHNCQASDQALMTVNAVPVVNAGADMNICYTASAIQMTGTPAGGTWSGDYVTSSGAYTPVGASTDSLFYTITQNGCSRSDTIVVNVSVPIPLQLTPDTTVCLNSGNFQLWAATLGGTWTSPNGTVSTSGIFTPNTVGTFLVSYSVGAGFCAQGGSLQITVIAPPLVDAGNPVSLCLNAPLYSFPGESPTSGGTWTWSGAGIQNTTTGTYNAAIGGVGNHTITYTFTSTATGCSASDNLVVTVNPLPVITLNPAVLNVCLTPFQSQLTALPVGGTWSGANLTYSNNLIAPQDSAVYTPTATGTFQAIYTYTDANTCTNRDTVFITVIPPAPVSARNDTSLCYTTGILQLQGTPVGGTWISPIWLNGNGSFVGTNTGTVPAIYTIGSGSCRVYDTTNVTVNPLPVVAAGSDQQLCAADPCFNLSAPSPLGGTWSGPGISNAATGQFCAASANNGSNQIIYTYQQPSTTCINRDTLLVNIVPMPIPGLSINPLFCINTNVPAVNLSSGPAATFVWNVRNVATGALVFTSTLASPQINVANVGNYALEQICYSIYNCETRDTAYFSTVAPPSPAFALADNVVCGPHQETVTNSSSGYNISFSWDFGPSGPGSTDTFPSLPVFAAPIISDTLYHVTLTVTNMCGVRSVKDSVILRPVPVALIGTDYSQGCSPFDAVYQNVSYGSPDWFLWDLGDGTTSTDSLPPAHTYTTAGSVSVISITLNIGNTCGTANAATSVIVYPNEINPPAQTPITGCAPFEVDFSFPLGDLTYYLWDFGDSTGMAGDSVSHIYDTPGTYPVMLTVSNFCLVDTILNTVNVLAGPELSFTINQPSICQSSEVSISNTSNNSSNVVVNFGDGTSSPINSTVNHIYLTSGNQTISISGINPTTGCVDTVTQILPVYPFPIITLSADPDSGCMPLAVQFYNTSSFATGYEWYFADGTSSILAEPAIVMPQAGDFAVQLIAHNYQGIGADCPDTVWVNIHVDPRPQSQFTLQADSACGPPATAIVTNTSVGAVSYTWEWEGNTSSAFEPPLAFSDTGSHAIHLISENTFTCRDTTENFFRVLGQPILGLQIDPPDGCAPHAVNFTNLSQYGDSVRWAFGDGEFSGLNNPVHVYEDAGVYSVELYVSSGNGQCADDSILVEVIQVNPRAEASIQVSPQVIYESSPSIDLFNTSSSANAFEFYIDDQLISYEVPANFVFDNPDTGFVQLKLIANNIFGCPDTAFSDIYIKSSPIIYIANSFSPNGDGNNEGFRPYLDRTPSYYYFSIYDRWGHIIFETFNREEEWNGTFQNRGKKDIKQDVYVYKLACIFETDQIYNVFGNITVIY